MRVYDGNRTRMPFGPLIHSQVQQTNICLIHSPPDETRTRDPFFDREVLLPLSYEGKHWI